MIIRTALATTVLVLVLGSIPAGAYEAYDATLPCRG